MSANSDPTEFTDEQIKGLKETIAYYRNMDLDYYESPIRIDALEGLLERLRWAEKCADLCATDENCCNIPELGENDISPYYLWRKAAGKSV